jgi:hypothetical protein
MADWNAIIIYFLVLNLIDYDHFVENYAKYLDILSKKINNNGDKSIESQIELLT